MKLFDFHFCKNGTKEQTPPVKAMTSNDDLGMNCFKFIGQS